MLLLATKDRHQWLVSLICADPALASGACHRSLQILELLQANGWQLQPLDPPDPPASRIVTVSAGLSAALRHGPIEPLSLASLRSQGHAALSVSRLITRFPGLTGVILEGTGFGSLGAISDWRRHGVRTVLVPANIESLAPNTGDWTHRGRDVPRRFSDERRWWAMADAIFTISIEEAWWLQLHGIVAENLPYYPPAAREQQLLAIRRQRRPDPCVGWLWLADFRNPANRAGVPLTLQWLQRCTDLPSQLSIAGHGSDWLQQNYGAQLPAFSRCLGVVDADELNHLSLHCEAQLIVHPATSGMLTRVVDAAIAGIPIVGNSMAFKSYVHCFSGRGTPAPPPRPLAAEALFLDALHR